MAKSNRARRTSALLFASLFGSCWILCYPASGQSNDRQTAERLTRELYEDRLSLTLAELKWTVHVLQHRKHPQLEGATYRYHAWYDFLENRIRVDTDNEVPSDPALTLKMRFAFSDRKYLIVDAEDLVGRETDGLGPEYMRDLESLTVFHLSTDPRLMGVFPIEFAFLKNYGLDAILELFHSSRDFSVSEEILDGRPVTKLQFLGYQGVDCDVTYWLDPASGSMPARILSHAATASGSLKIEVRSQWRYFDSQADAALGAWLPIETVTRRWERDQQKNHERVTLEDAVLGLRPGEDLFQWKAMNIPDDFVVRHVSGKTTQMKQWNAEAQSFGPWEATPLVVAEAQSVDLGPGRGGVWWTMIVVNAVAVVVLFGYLLWKRRRDRAQ